jgi:hypothetical protein
MPVPVRMRLGDHALSYAGKWVMTV